MNQPAQPAALTQDAACRPRRRDRLAVALLDGFARLPLPVNHACGYVIGRLGYGLAHRLRRITLTNLRLCFPHRDDRWHRRVARQSSVESARALTEAPYLWRRAGQRGIAPLIRAVTGQDQLDAARAQGRGVVFVTPHLGCWEITSLYMARDYPLTCLYRPNRNRLLDARLRRARQSTGARLVPAGKEGIKQLLAALRRGECIGLLPDQPPRAGTGVFAPFFGVAAYSAVLAPRLAARCQAPVILIHAHRLARAAGYALAMETVPETVNDPDPVVAVTALNQAIEALAARNPAQYNWSYKRFKHRPNGRSAFY